MMRKMKTPNYSFLLLVVNPVFITNIKLLSLFIIHYSFCNQRASLLCTMTALRVGL